jgi:hypothetical protein
MSHSRIRALSVAIAIPAALAAAGPGQAAQSPITLKLSKPGYTVVALAPNGRAASARARGVVRLKAPARSVTLHLIGAGGTYAGPVVVGKRSAKALLGVKAGANLGLVVVRKGYASPARPLKRQWVDATKSAAAKAGVPLGARVFGRVRAKVSGPAGDGIDQDRDGIPGAYDVDDDGDLILDNFERRTGPLSVFGHHSFFEGPTPPLKVHLFSNLKKELEGSLNANAAAVTDAQVNQLVAQTATLAIGVPDGGAVELDCGGLSYCSKGGTGRALTGFGGPLLGPRFPDDFDADNDGFGTLTRGPTGDFQLFTGAGTAAIGSGNAFIYRVATGGAETQIPATLNYIFSTTPALQTYVTGAGSGTISYPVSPGSTGTMNHPIWVPSGDGKVTMTYWRPQRKAIAGSGEGTGWVDIGKLNYTADVPNGPSSGGPGSSPGPGPGNCRPESYSTTDPSLSVTGNGVVDAASDRPADPANTLTFTVDLNACLAASGLTWGSGQSLKVDIQARSEFGDNAAQAVFFKRN